MTTALAKVNHEKEDTLMAEQIGEQYHRATGGMREVLKFGAMMMMLREVLSARGTNSATRGSTAKGQGIKPWLEKHRSDVKIPTAYRFEDVAKAVAQRFELPGRVAKQLTFEQLVTADPKDLSDKARSAQEKIFEFVDGTSQRSILDDFREAKDKGGRRTKGDGKSEPEDPHGEALEAWTLLSTEAHDRAFGEGIYKAEWDLLTTAELGEIDARLFRVHELFRDAIRARKSARE